MKEKGRPTHDRRKRWLPRLVRAPRRPAGRLRGTTVKRLEFAACAGSQHGRSAALDYLHMHPRSEAEAGEQRKAARLALDTSTHSGGDYQRLLKKLQAEESLPHKVSWRQGSLGSLGVWSERP